MKYMRRTAGCTWTDYKTNAQIAKELKITQILDKLLEYKRSWIQRVNRMPRNRLPRVMKYYSPPGRRNRGRPLKRLRDTWDWNGSKSGPTAWKICDDDFRSSFLSDNSKQFALVVIRDASTTLPISGWMNCSYSKVTISFFCLRVSRCALCAFVDLFRLNLTRLPGSGQFIFPASYAIRTCSSDSISPPDTTGF